MQALYTQKDREADLANIGVRLIAFTIDALLIYALIAIIDYFTFSSNDDAVLLKPELILYILFGWLYFAGSETCPGEASLGKKLLGLRVTSTTGNRLSFKRASVRYFSKPLTFFAIVMRFILESEGPTRQLLHDRLAHALVVPKNLKSASSL